MVRGKGSDFEMIEGEGILRQRNKNKAKTGKNFILIWNEKKKEEEGGRIE